MCNRGGEDGGHLFLKCKCVKELWRSAGLEYVRCTQADGCVLYCDGMPSYDEIVQRGNESSSSSESDSDDEIPSYDEIVQ